MFWINVSFFWSNSGIFFHFYYPLLSPLNVKKKLFVTKSWLVSWWAGQFFLCLQRIEKRTSPVKKRLLLTDRGEGLSGQAPPVLHQILMSQIFLEMLGDWWGSWGHQPTKQRAPTLAEIHSIAKHLDLIPCIWDVNYWPNEHLPLLING